MINKFLIAKHWQLFILMFGLPMLSQLFMISSIFTNINSGTASDPSAMFYSFRFFPVIMILYIGTFLGWFWSIATGLQSKIPKNIKMNTKRFKVFFFIPLIYFVFISLFVLSMFNQFMHIESESFVSMGKIIIFIAPLHLLSMFSMFHSMYFVAKTFKTVELQREVVFGDFAGEFFLLWFYIVGVWIVQPKINKMMENKKITNNI